MLVVVPRPFGLAQPLAACGSEGCSSCHPHARARRQLAARSSCTQLCAFAGEGLFLEGEQQRYGDNKFLVRSFPEKEQIIAAVLDLWCCQASEMYPSQLVLFCAMTAQLQCQREEEGA